MLNLFPPRASFNNYHLCQKHSKTYITQQRYLEAINHRHSLLPPGTARTATTMKAPTLSPLAAVSTLNGITTASPHPKQFTTVVTTQSPGPSTLTPIMSVLLPPARSLPLRPTYTWEANSRSGVCNGRLISQTSRASATTAAMASKAGYTTRTTP